MNPTDRDYEKLARTYCLASGVDPDEWEDQGIDQDETCVSTTRDTLDDFRRNSQDWREPGHMEEVEGGLYWEKCQALKGQPRCEVCVVDCGEFRLCYQV